MCWEQNKPSREVETDFCSRVIKFTKKGFSSSAQHLGMTRVWWWWWWMVNVNKYNVAKVSGRKTGSLPNYIQQADKAAEKRAVRSLKGTL